MDVKVVELLAKRIQKLEKALEFVQTRSAPRLSKKQLEVLNKILEG